ncbi:MAG TPA: cellulase family glycosylhydrolase [Chitinispirillaceae bacterium]|nr:cellulase family glycosylhydrolase [Chitinispirillaceae bacterium]
MVKKLFLKIVTGIIAFGAIFYCFSATPVEKHGWLQTKDQYLLNEKGNIVQLKGMSFFWSTTDWPGYQYYNAETVNALVNDWKCTVVRVAYDRNPNSWNSVKTVIDAAIAKGIYVIIDWHAHDAHKDPQQGINFFKDQATTYKKTPNVIFEPYNEPITDDGSRTDGSENKARETWKAIKPYLTSVTKEVRNAGAKNLIILGTPFFCQHAHIAANDQIVNDNGDKFENVAYSFHFYAASHGPEAFYVKNGDGSGGMESEYLSKAVSKVPIFITEWGTTHSDGGESGEFNEIDENNTDWWFENFVDRYHLGHCNWSVSSFQISSAFSGGTNPSRSGQIVRKYLLNNTEDEFTPVWKEGFSGPAGDNTFTMPGTHLSWLFNKYYGSHITQGKTSYSNRDKDDPRNSKDSVLKVTPSTSEEWLTYNIKSNDNTSYIGLRVFTANGGGKITISVDDNKEQEITLQQQDGWSTIYSDLSVTSGNHTLKFEFSNTTGEEYYVQWFELTNTTNIFSHRTEQILSDKSNITILKNGFSVSLPVSHDYTSFSLTGINGRTIKSGKINNNIRQMEFNDLSTGIWFFKLNQGQQSKIHKIVTRVK